jgi:hypothetical protein
MEHLPSAGATRPLTAATHALADTRDTRSGDITEQILSKIRVASCEAPKVVTDGAVGSKLCVLCCNRCVTS